MKSPLRDGILHCLRRHDLHRWDGPEGEEVTRIRHSGVGTTRKGSKHLYTEFADGGLRG
jgi:hypothetical protein